MASSLLLPLMAGAEILALDNEPLRPVFEYVSGKKSDTPRLHPVSHRPLYRARALLKLTPTSGEEVSLLIDSDVALGGFLRPIKVDMSSATLTIRPEDSFNLVLTVTASLIPEKG